MLRLLAATLGLLAYGLVAPAGAQDWPARKPIVFVSGFPAGGATDILARVIAQKLSEQIGQSVIVDNKTGAGGMIGTDFVAKSAPDGYTFLLGSHAAMASGLALQAKVPYDAVRDFAPVTMVGRTTIALVANPSIAAKTFPELVALAKAQPGKISIAIPSLGTIQHLVVEQLKKEAAIDLTNVTYRGSAPAIADLLSGAVQLDLDSLPAMIQHVQAGRLRALFVADKARSPLLPDVPTVSELGMPDLTANPWFVLVGPAGTPPAIIERLNREVVAILKTPDIAAKFAAQGLDPMWSTPEEATAFIKSEITRWAKVVRETGARAE